MDDFNDCKLIVITAIKMDNKLAININIQSNLIL